MYTIVKSFWLLKFLRIRFKLKTFYVRTYEISKINLPSSNTIKQAVIYTINFKSNQLTKL